MGSLDVTQVESKTCEVLFIQDYAIASSRLLAEAEGLVGWVRRSRNPTAEFDLGLACRVTLR